MTKIEELRAAYEAATPGEWFARKGDTFNPARTYGIVRVLSPDEHGCDPEDRERTEVIAEVFDTAHDEGRADAHFIALMKNALPALIAAARALEDLVDRTSNILTESQLDAVFECDGTSIRQQWRGYASALAALDNETLSQAKKP